MCYIEMSYLKYKAAEDKLKILFLEIGLTVRLEPIDSADKYYTDGDATASVCKIIITGGPTIYLPQLIYNVNETHKKIIQTWLDTMKHD